jgi:long-chain acyl-CoA synthetase
MSSRRFLVDAFSRHAAERPNAVAVATLDESRTFAELDAAASRMANFLLTSGAAPGDRVGVVSRSRLELVEMLLACVRAGLTLVPCNWRFTASELRDVVTASELSLLVADSSIVPPGLWAGVRVIDVDQLEGLLAGTSPVFEASDRDDVPLWHLYTSGTTARPKAAMTMPANLASGLANWISLWGLDTGSVLWNPYPSFHLIFTGVNMLVLSAGGRIECRASATIEDFVWSVEERRVTHTVMVPAVLRKLLDRPDLGERDLSSLRRIVCGSAPTPADLLQRFFERIPGCVLSNGYGSTESTTPIAHIDYSPEDVDGERIHSVGRPVPWMEVSLHDATSGDPVAHGEVGEIWIRSDSCVPGYWREPEATALTMLPDGWLRTGDLGRLDEDGYLYLSDRLGDLIISGGENISAAEVESVLSQFVGVREVVVVGAPHDRWGEAPIAFVEVEDGQTVDPESLIAFARKRLAGYKVPAEVRLIGALPRTPFGKVLRRDLRQRARQDIDPTSAAREPIR